MPMRSPYCHPHDRGLGRGDRRRGALPKLNNGKPVVDRQRMSGQPPRCHPPGPPDVPVPALEEPRWPRGGGRAAIVGVCWTCLGRQRSCGAASGSCCSVCSSSGTLAVFNALPEDCAWRVVGWTAGMSSRASLSRHHCIVTEMEEREAIADRQPQLMARAYEWVPGTVAIPC